MALIYQKQLFLSGSIPLHGGIFTDMAMPTSSYDSVNKLYVDQQIQFIVTGSNSFINLVDTPKVYNEGRVLFEGTTSVLDHANFRFLNNNLLTITGSLSLSNILYLGNNQFYYSGSGVSPNRVVGLYTRMETGEEVIVSSRIV